MRTLREGWLPPAERDEITALARRRLSAPRDLGPVGPDRQISYDPRRPRRDVCRKGHPLHRQVGRHRTASSGETLPRSTLASG